MFNADDFVKIILAVSCSLALVGIAFAIVRLLNKVTATIEDARKPIQNIGEVSDLALDDYKHVRGFVSNSLGVFSFIKNLTSGYSKKPSKVEEEDPEDVE